MHLTTLCFFSMHISESQQEFFRMLDEKIEKVRSKVTAYFKGNVASCIKSNNILCLWYKAVLARGWLELTAVTPHTQFRRWEGLTCDWASQDPGLIFHWSVETQSEIDESLCLKSVAIMVCCPHLIPCSARRLQARRSLVPAYLVPAQVLT